MLDYQRSLIAILFLAANAFWFLRRPLTTTAIDPADYRRRAALWLGLTVVLFMAHSFWVFMFISAAVLLTVGRRDSNPVALYFFLLLMAPPIKTSIDGFAGITRFIDFDYLRLLSLVLLLPAALKPSVSPGAARLFSLPSDKFVLGYLALQLALVIGSISVTDVMRTIVVFAIDVFLPYYVVSRWLSSVERMRDALAAFVASCFVIGVIAIFEAGKGWLLYAPLPEVLGVAWGYGHYMFRESSLRAIASAGHSIYLGYVMMAALGLHFALRPSFPAGRTWIGVFLVLAGGVAASLARGPWMGTVAMLVVAAGLSPNAKAVYGKIGLASVVLVPLVMATPFGPKIVALLPFVGKFDEGSVDYRQQLFTVSWDVLMMNPILGSPYYMSSGALESMRQGEGIIDMVNSYLGVALASGFLGLTLFLGAFLPSGVRLWSLLRHSDDKFSEEYQIGRGLLAALVGILVTIATVGSDALVPVVYWCIAGACAAYVHRAGTSLSGWRQPSVEAGSTAASSA